MHAGNVWAGIADTYGVHRKLFIASYVVSSLLRFSLSLVGSFPLIFAIMVATEITSSPVPVLMDASVMVASQAGLLHLPLRPHPAEIHMLLAPPSTATPELGTASCPNRIPHCTCSLQLFSARVHSTSTQPASIGRLQIRSNSSGQPCCGRMRQT